MAFALIDRTSEAVGANGGTSGAIDTTGATLIVLSVAFYSGAIAGTLTVDDSESNTWEPGTIVETANGEESVQQFYCIDPITSATHTFDGLCTNGFVVLSVDAFSADGDVSFVNESAGGKTDSGTSVQPGSLSATQNGSLFVTGLNFSLRNTATINSSFDDQSVDWSSGVNVGGASAHKIQGTAGAENPTWSWSGAGEGAAAMMLFEESGGGGVVFDILNSSMIQGAM